VPTGAGVPAGIDAALRVAARLTNDEVARTVQLAIEYDPHPPHGAIEWSYVDRDSSSPAWRASQKRR
jgi:hypothetical protein